MELNDIPKNKTKDFPTGVSEVRFDTHGEITAFLHGLSYADDVDVEAGEPFERGDKFVVRVRVGDWGDDDDDELSELARQVDEEFDDDEDE